ncbi:MAG: tetratricopeptide repeat protein [Anaerolineales bacterium]|nr:MAG: tetratricopeptide repeat protein [Anaerolineales bacterium]
MRLTGERLRLSRNGKRSNPWRILIYIILIAGGVLLLQLEKAGQVQPLFLPAPGPTRSAQSYAGEGEVHFSAGDLEKAIGAYKLAASIEPDNVDLWYKLARIQTYSSDLLTTPEARRTRLSEARESIERAIEVDPENTTAYAIRALVYDWSATAELKDSIWVGDVVRIQAVIDEGGGLTARIIELADSAELGESITEEETMYIFSGVVEDIGQDAWRVNGRTVIRNSQTLIRDPNRREEFLTEAEASATQAQRLDPNNNLALAFYAEVLVDMQKFAQALDLSQRAAEVVDQAGDQYEFSMDIYRVYGTVLENHGFYLRAIEEYQKAERLSPNLTFLSLSIGANYRRLRDVGRALEYFDKAAQINHQLGIMDPTPYLAIGKTYQQQGEFFIAAINIERALAIDPGNPDIYGRLGIAYFQARNWESAMAILKCAVRGCTVEESRESLCRFVYRSDDLECEEGQKFNQGVRGLELGSNSLEYYYTYGSVLAAYNGHEDYPNVCSEAEDVFDELMAQYGDDPIVSSIVIEGRAICASPGSTPDLLSTPTPFPDESS